MQMCLAVKILITKNLNFVSVHPTSNNVEDAYLFGVS